MEGREASQGAMGATGAEADTQPATIPAPEAKPLAGAKNLDVLLDIPMQVSVQLGTTRMIIRELLQLGQGSVVELDKLAGEPLEVLVNHRLVARGEVVVVNEKFGVRLTDVVSPVERVQKLG
ncbi:MAG TPA: flagellar motor switch protein FliN [Nitrospiraceae bacterium]|nr:flagellar motor switch protein FliN [Nitrospiraceae bacterium]